MAHQDYRAFDTQTVAFGRDKVNRFVPCTLEIRTISCFVLIILFKGKGNQYFFVNNEHGCSSFVSFPFGNITVEYVLQYFSEIFHGYIYTNERSCIILALNRSLFLVMKYVVC